MIVTGGCAFDEQAGAVTGADGGDAAGDDQLRAVGFQIVGAVAQLAVGVPPHAP